MEKIICASCGATLTPNTTQAFLTCEYCDTTVPNAYYNESDAKAAAEPTLEEICVKALLEMGENEKLADADESCFGNPVPSSRSAREAMGIPEEDKVYLLLDHLTILGSIKEGFALTDSGLYYKHDGDEGSRSWEAFITGAISCRDRTSWQQEGTLSIGSTLSFSITTDAESRLARFLVDFHNHVYHQITGKTAPESWAVTDSSDVAAAADTTLLGDDQDGGSIVDTVASAARSLLGGSLLGGSLLGGAALGSSVLKRGNTPSRPTIMQPIRKPAPSKYHTPKAAAARAAKQQQRTDRSGGMARPTDGLDNLGRPGARDVRSSKPRPNDRGAMANPGARDVRSSMPRPNDRGGMGGPGGRGGMGGPGGMRGPGRGKR